MNINSQAFAIVRLVSSPPGRAVYPRPHFQLGFCVAASIFVYLRYLQGLPKPGEKRGTGAEGLKGETNIYYEMQKNFSRTMTAMG